ncbi:MAG: DUF4838 domain-containing protein, partial [Clostridia bacterium]|nr:DUF4838 domain-containing protein [Clostridia bacterium]
TENPSGQAFMECLRGWSVLCDDIFLWDYGINFDNYLSPFPNLGTIKANMEIFRDHGVKMHFSQINSTLGGDFAELRPYLVSKLMWNASASLDSLERHFCDAYYGAASPYILHYIHELEGAAVATDVDLFIYDSPVSYKENILRQPLLYRYLGLFDEAEAAVADDPVKLARVRRSRLPLQYSCLELARTNPVRDDDALSDALDLFESRIREYGIETLNERGNSPLDYCAMYRDRYLRSSRGNLAYACPVSYVIPPKERYAEPGGNVDRERFLSEVLLPLSRGEAFAYRPLICPAMELGAPVCVERPDIAIVEGSYSQHPDLRGYMDLTVFLTLPPAVQRKRILARNGVEKLAVFIERWIPLEEKYFSSLGVEKAADIVLGG